MENLDPLRQKPDFDKLLRSIGHGVISRSIALKLCEHVWTSHVEPLIADRDKFAIGFARWLISNNWAQLGSAEKLIDMYKESLLNQKP